MSFFTERTLEKYAYGYSALYSGGSRFQYPRPDEWMIQAYSGYNSYTLPAVDSIHGRRILAIGDNVVMTSGEALRIDIVNDDFGQDYFGPGQNLTCVELSFSQYLEIPGPGFILTSATGKTYVMCCRLQDNIDQIWHGYEVTITSGVVTSWLESQPIVASAYTSISSIQVYSGSILTADISHCTDDLTPVISLLCYDHDDAITGVLPGDQVLPSLSGINQYVQCLCPLQTTRHAWPFWADSNQFQMQFLKSYRAIAGQSLGYTLTATADMSMITAVGNIWIDGLMFNVCGLYINANPTEQIGMGLVNNVFIAAPIAIRLTYLPGHGNVINPIRGIDHCILQNLFVDCDQAISDDMIRSYVGMQGVAQDEIQSQPWSSTRRFGFNTFDGGQVQLKLERINYCRESVEIFENVFAHAKTKAVDTPDFGNDIRSFGNICGDHSVLDLCGYDDRHDVILVYSEVSDNGYRPDLHSWYEHEMSAGYVPFDCGLTADITGIRHLFMGSAYSSACYAAPALAFSSHQPNFLAYYQSIDGGELDFADMAEADDKRPRVTWMSYSNSAKGCFNPIVPDFSQSLFFSVGRRQHNLMTSLSSPEHTGFYNLGDHGYVKAMINSTSGIMRCPQMYADCDIGCGDVITGWLNNGGNISESLTAVVSAVIAPGVYSVMNQDGSQITAMADTYGNITAYIYSVKRAYPTLQSAVDAIHTAYPNLAVTNKLISVVCYDDIVYGYDPVKSVITTDLSGENGCVVIPEAWSASSSGRLTILAANNGNISVKPQSWAGNPGKGFTLRYDATDARAIFSVAGGSDYCQIRGVRLKAETIRNGVKPRTYIGIGLDPSITKFMADSNEILNCNIGINQ